MNNVLTVGDIGIQRIIEIEGPFLPALDVFPTLSVELLDENRHWLAPKALVRDDRLVFSARRIILFWSTPASARQGEADATAMESEARRDLHARADQCKKEGSAMANGGRLPRAPQEASARAVAPEPRAVLTRSIGSKTSTKERYWIAVASKDHVANGVTQGIAQANHGKRSPMKRLSRGDKIIYYSSKKTFGKPELYQMFTAIGEVIDDESHVGVMSGDFQPIRRNIRYFKAHDTPIAPLIDSLTFIKDKTKWGYMFRFGFLEIPKQDYEAIYKNMR